MVCSGIGRSANDPRALESRHSTPGLPSTARLRRGAPIRCYISRQKPQRAGAQVGGMIFTDSRPRNVSAALLVLTIGFALVPIRIALRASWSSPPLTIAATLLVSAITALWLYGLYRRKKWVWWFTELTLVIVLAATPWNVAGQHAGFQLDLYYVQRLFDGAGLVLLCSPPVRQWFRVSATNRFLISASGLAGAVVVLAVAHFYLPNGISAARGQWQIKDWYFHPNATREQLQRYENERKRYPRVIDIDSFGRGSIDLSEKCSWTESLSQQLGIAELPTVWATSLKCDKRNAIKLIVRPFSSALTLRGLFSYYFDANDSEMSAEFRDADSALIDYVPAKWPRPSIDDLLNQQSQETVIRVYRDHFEIGGRTFASVDELRGAALGSRISYSIRDCAATQNVRDLLALVGERAVDGLATIYATESPLRCATERP
jgi:hypothetical protein